MAELFLARTKGPNGFEKVVALKKILPKYTERQRYISLFCDEARLAAAELRKEYKTTHPFALKNVLLVADKADVFVTNTLRESAREAEDPKLLSLTTRNYTMYEALKHALLPGVSFDPDSNLADEWKPIPDRFPMITVNPMRAFGQPTTPKGVPTATLFDAWKAEGRNADTVADWYGVKVKEVISAVRFEQALDDPSLVAAA